MQLYAITDRHLFAGREALMEQVALWADAGVEYLQIREKDLDSAALSDLSAEIVGIVRAAQSPKTRTKVLLNGPAALAAATGCDGVHLRSGMGANAVADARRVMPSDSVISISCHTLAEIESARDQGATMALFAPVFEKCTETVDIPGQGLPALKRACSIASPMPIFALGGVTANNAKDCVEAGAAGVAAIRLFVSDAWRSIR
jgi:thiamine-phosphate pyrophosphorylase